MKIFDISQDLLTGTVYDGDPLPKLKKINNIGTGDSYNLSYISFCSHNATHIDAPYHFIKDGKTIEQIDLQKCIGQATVKEIVGRINVETIRIVAKKGCKRLLLKGKCTITIEIANELVSQGVWLLGVETNTVGTTEDEEIIHKILLSNEIVIIENLDLSNVTDGDYFLSAAPLKISGSDGSPCRALLWQED